MLIRDAPFFGPLMGISFDMISPSLGCMECYVPEFDLWIVTQLPVITAAFAGSAIGEGLSKRACSSICTPVA